MCHHAGSENQFRLVLRKMRLDGEIASKLGPRGGSKGGVERIYRLMNGGDAMPEESVSEPQAEDVDVLRVRAEAEVDEIELERIEASEPTPSEAIERRSAERPEAMSVEDLARIEDTLNGLLEAKRNALEYDEYEMEHDTQDQPENEVSETVEEAIAAPISNELPPFLVGVYSDETMVLEKPGELFWIDKTEFAVLVEFARTVGWLPA